MRSPRLLPFAAALAACATAADRPVGEPPAARIVGAAVQCIPITLIRESRVQTDRVIDFVMKDTRVFRNTLPSACPGLGFERRISYTTPLTQLCTADLVTALTLSPIGRGATCALGAFQPVELAPATRRRRSPR